MEDDFKEKERGMKNSADYVKEVNKQIHDTGIENERLRTENFRLKLEVKEVLSLKEDLDGILHDRDYIEKSIKTLT